MLVKKNPITTFWAYIVGALLIWAVVGCGGSGGDSSAGGKVAMKIAWPAPSRYLPTYAKSIVFNLYQADNGANPRFLVVNRPETLPLVQTVQFDGPIPAGLYAVSGEAKTEPNGLGDTVASASNVVFVEATGTTTVSMTLGTTLQSISLANTPLHLEIGQSQQLMVVVTDKDGNQIMLPEGALNWSLLFGGDNLELDQNGLVTGVANGNARVRVSEVGANLYADGDIGVGDIYGENATLSIDRRVGIDFKTAKTGRR